MGLREDYNELTNEELLERYSNKEHYMPNAVKRMEEELISRGINPDENGIKKEKIKTGEDGRKSFGDKMFMLKIFIGTICAFIFSLIIYKFMGRGIIFGLSGTVTITLGIIFIFNFYFLPYTIVKRKRNPLKNIYLFLNIFFGVTIIGWVILFMIAGEEPEHSEILES